MRPIIFTEDTNEENLPSQLFNISDVTGRETDRYLDRVLQTNILVQQKVQKIIDTKARGNCLIEELDE